MAPRSQGPRAIQPQDTHLVQGLQASLLPGEKCLGGHGAQSTMKTKMETVAARLCSWAPPSALEAFLPAPHPLARSPHPAPRLGTACGEGAEASQECWAVGASCGGGHGPPARLTDSSLEAPVGLGARPAVAHGVVRGGAHLLGFAPTSWGGGTGEGCRASQGPKPLPQARSPEASGSSFPLPPTLRLARPRGARGPWPPASLLTLVQPPGRPVATCPACSHPTPLGLRPWEEGGARGPPEHPAVVWGLWLWLGARGRLCLW